MITPEAVKNALDFAAFYQSELGELKPGTNGNHLGLCPFHEDTEPSLSVNLQSGLYKCFGCQAKGDVFDFHQAKHGCDFKESLEELAQIAGVNGYQAQAKKPKIVKAYDYLDVPVELLFQVCRMEPKSFRQRRPDPQNPGKWIWNLQGVDRIPYRLPEILKADEVAIVEGEKDADALTALKVTATCNPGGAGKWKADFNQHFKNKKVVIIPDNDDPGRAHAQDVAKNLHGVAAVVKVVELPGLPEKGDVSDWIAAGGTIEKLSDLVKAAPEWEPSTSPPQVENSSKKSEKGEADTGGTLPGHGLTDQGNAYRFKDQWGEEVRWCDPWGKFLIWDGCRWTPDQVRKVEHLGIETVKAIYAEASKTKDKDSRKAIADHAKRSEADNKRKAMLSTVKCLLPVLPDELDRDPFLLNVLNGTVDLRTGELRPYSRDDFITKLAPVHFDQKAKCPLWWEFLSRILPGESIGFVQKAVGYSANGLTVEQVFFLLFGGGDNGKSVFLETIGGVLGDYSKETDPETFMLKKHSGIPNDLAALRGARFVKSVETSGGRRMSEARIKQMTGGDTLTARFLHAEWFQFKPEFKLWLATNHKPKITDSTHSMWRRVRLIPFEVQIPKNEQDKRLPEKLRAEYPGILNWIIEGALLWQHEGLEPPEAIREATQSYREEMDDLADFLNECCIIAPGASGTAADLFKAYKDWAERTGEKKPMGKIAFGLALGERGFQKKKGTGGTRFWHGIGVA